LPAAAKPVDAARPAGGGAGARVKNLMGRGPYAVQVAAVTDRAAAAALAERLRRQGLPATTVTATAKGKTWYRLRVGSFPNREAAVRAAGLLHAELGLEATPVRN
jgi:septal ring-binding cell division protein DamX